MERICASCGSDPGAGAFCQYCGTRQPDPAPPPSPDASPAGQPPATPPLIPNVPAKRQGFRLGCLIAAVIILGGLGVGAFLVWNFVNNEVLPGLEEATDAFSPLSESPPGPCFDIQASNGVLTGWEEVACDGERDVEVSFAALFEDGPFPGDQHLVDSATNTCRRAFENYVGIPPDQSEYDVEWMVPTEDQWASGVRNGICLVVADDGSPLTGIVKGSNR